MRERLRKWVHLSKAIVSELQPDLITSYTASVAWFIMLSFLPLMIVLLSLVRFLPFVQTETITFNVDFVPLPFQDLLQSVLNEITQNTSTIALPIGALTGVVSASTGFSSLIKGLNVIYRRRETRPMWRVRVMCLVHTVVFLCILVVVLVLIVFGKALLHILEQSVLRFSDSGMRIINWRLWMVVLILSVFFTMLYNIIPNRKSKWYNEAQGALFSACLWIIFSHLYSLYIANFDRFSKIYGSLTLIILLMIWLYACILIVFIGAYVNVLLQSWTCYKQVMRKRG